MYPSTSSTYSRTRPSSGSVTNKYSSPIVKSYSPSSSSSGSMYSTSYTSSYGSSGYNLRSSRDDIGRSSSYNNLSSYSLGSSFNSMKLDSSRLDSASYGSLKRRASKTSALPPIDRIADRYSSDRYSSDRYSSDRYSSSIPKPSSGADSYSTRSHLLESSSSSRIASRYGRSKAGDSSVADERSSDNKKQGGLRNIGNSCYLNSVIQCILHCEPLKQYLISGRHKGEINSRSKARGQVAESSGDLFKSLLSGQTASPSAVKSAVQSTSGLFRGTAQEDAQEFLRWYLEALHEDVSRVTTKPRIHKEACSASEAWAQYTSRENSTVVDLCVGQLKSSLTCSSCGYVSEVWDPFWDLSVPIPSRARDIKDCLNEFQREEVLDGSEKPKCERCKTRRRMTKKFSIEKCPKVLVIHLKRFGDSIGYSRSKISTSISFPMRLSEFGGSYSLQAVCNHSGGVGGGHYIAYGKTNDGWFEYNDSRVSSIPESSVQSRDAYLLFYTK